MFANNRTSDARPRREVHFECIALHKARGGADDRKTRLLVVAPARKNHSRPAPRLFPARLRRKIEPDQIAGIRHILAGYHSSLPSGAPRSVSVWGFAAAISRMRSLSFEVPFFLRILTVPEPSTDNFRLSPGRSLAASATFLGIRTAMLLPHFATCVFTARHSLQIQSNYARHTQVTSPA